MNKEQASPIDLAKEDMLRLNGMNGDSLNAGYGLDDDESADAVYIQMEDPSGDIVTDFKLTIDLQNHLDDLGYLLQSIRSTGGMSQSFALEARSVFDQFDEGTPIGFYSKEPTATRYKVALEGIGKRIWDTIKALVESVMNMFKKIFNFIRGKSGESKDPVKENEERGEGAEKAQEEIKTFKDDVIPEANSLLSKHHITVKNDRGEEKECKSLHELVDHVLLPNEKYRKAKELLETTNPIFHDIAFNGPYSKTMYSLANSLWINLNTLLMQRLDIINEAVRANVNARGYDKIVKERSLIRLKEQLKPIEVDFMHEQMNLREIVHRSKEMEKEVQAKEVKQAVSFDDLFRRLDEGWSRMNYSRVFTNMGKALKYMVELRQCLDALKKEMGDLTTDGTGPGRLSEEVGEYVRVAVAAISHDIASLGELLYQVYHYVEYLHQLTTSVFGLTHSAFTEIIHSFKQNGQEVPKEWEELSKKAASHSNDLMNYFKRALGAG